MSNDDASKAETSSVSFQRYSGEHSRLRKGEREGEEE